MRRWGCSPGYLGNKKFLFIAIYLNSSLTRKNSTYRTVWLYKLCTNTWLRLSLIIFTNPSARAGYDSKSIFKRSLTGLNSQFSFSETTCLTKVEEASLPYYLPTAAGRIIGFTPFPRVLVLCKMQSVSSRIWTRVNVSISYDDNHYTTGTSPKIKFNC